MAPAPLATGENLFSYDDARNLLRYGDLHRERDFLQFDPLLSYGVAEYVRILELYADWPRTQFHAACRASFRRALRRGPRSRHGRGGAGCDACPTAATGTACASTPGALKIPDIPGVGFEAKANLFAVLENL